MQDESSTRSPSGWCDGGVNTYKGLIARVSVTCEYPSYLLLFEGPMSNRSAPHCQRKAEIKAQSTLPLPPTPTPVRFIPTYDVGETPPVNSSLESLLDRSSLMDVQYRSMQRQHQLIYLAALDDDPSVPADEVPDINFQAYAGFDMAEAGYQTFTGEVRVM